MKTESKYPKGAGVYKLTCSKNGKVYVGKSVDMYFRLSCHKSVSEKAKGNYYFENALIKYGKENGTTEVTIEDLVNDKIIVRIRDNGEGIEKKYIPRLFERFFRVDKSGARSEGGSGLGLAIVKHIIEAHGEKIYVESEFGKSSGFSFTLEKYK